MFGFKSIASEGFNKRTHIKFIFASAIFCTLSFFVIADITFSISGVFDYRKENLNVVTLILLYFIPVLVLLFLLQVVKFILSDSQSKIIKDIATEKKLELLTSKINRLEGNLLKLKSLHNNNKTSADNQFLNPNNRKSLSWEPLEQQLELDVNDSSTFQPEFELEKSVDTLDWDLLLRALHFPNDKSDSMGFEALKTARKNAKMDQLLSASKDFLSFLAQEGIYLDDIEIDPPPINAWFEFLENDRTTLIKKLSSLNIEKLLPNLKAKMKSDIVFRDATLIFISRFDSFIREQLRNANEPQIFNLAFTRTGKAFIVAGKISGAF